MTRLCFSWFLSGVVFSVGLIDSVVFVYYFLVLCKNCMVSVVLSRGCSINCIFMCFFIVSVVYSSAKAVLVGKEAESWLLRRDPGEFSKAPNVSAEGTVRQAVQR